MKTSEITFKEFVAFCGRDAAVMERDFLHSWDAMMAHLPPNEYGDCFLSDAAVISNAKLCHQEENETLLLKIAKGVRGNRGLLTLFALMHHVLFEDGMGAGTWIIPYPQCSFPSEKEEGPFNLLLSLGFAPIFKRENLRRGIPVETISESLLQINCYCMNFVRKYGTPGIFTRQLCWLHSYVPPKNYFRLGRLEFQSDKFAGNYVVYKNKYDGNVVAFIKDSIYILQDGTLAQEDAFGAIRSVLLRDDFIVRGNRVLDNGYVQREVTELPLDRWELALSDGDEILSFHIPSGGKMTPELICESIGRAFHFFDDYFPVLRPKALVCSSWIFSAQLQEALPEKSNILAFQRMVHLTPLIPHEGSENGLWFLYLRNGPYDPKTLPKETSMQRDVALWMENTKKRFNSGACFLLRSEVEKGR